MIAMNNNHAKKNTEILPETIGNWSATTEKGTPRPIPGTVWIRAGISTSGGTNGANVFPPIILGSHLISFSLMTISDRKTSYADSGST